MSGRMKRLLVCVFVASIFGCDSAKPTESVGDADATSPPKIVANGPLRLFVLDDQPLATVLEREWRAISSYEIEVTNGTAKEVLRQFDAGEEIQETDVIIFPSPMLGELVEKRLLRPTPKDLLAEPEYQSGDIFSHVRRRETQWNRQPYAVPLGSPTLVLLRRTDLVPNAPETWEDLDAEALRLRSSLPDGVIPLAQPFADGWGSRLLLIRAASYLYDSSRVSTVFNFATMEPRIASAPFVRAANELAATLVGANRDHTPATVLQEFLDGKAAMAVTWPSAFRSESESPVEFPVAISALPGSREFYQDSELTQRPDGEVTNVTMIGVDGRLGAVSRNAKNAAIANIFLAWATNPTQSVKLCTRSSHTAPFRLSHKSSADRWTSTALPQEGGTAYFEVIKQSLSRSTAIHFPRLPGQHQYVDALNDAMKLIVIEKQSADDSLQAAATKWKSITADYGLESQKSAYRRSLGIGND